MPRSARSQVAPPIRKKSLRKFPRLVNLRPGAVPTHKIGRADRSAARSGGQTVSPPVEGTAPRCSSSIQDGTPMPADVGLELLGRLPQPGIPSELLRFVDFPTSPESTLGANCQPVYRERIRECSIAHPFPTGIASSKSRARESLMQPMRPHEAVESRSRAEGQQQYQKQCRDCHAPPYVVPGASSAGREQDQRTTLGNGTAFSAVAPS